MQCFAKLTKLPGFTGQVKPGRSIWLPAATVKLCEECVNVADTEEGELEGYEEEDDDVQEEDNNNDVEEEEEAYDMAYEVLKVLSDGYADEL